jgi:hypothetical protein
MTGVKSKPLWTTPTGRLTEAGAREIRRLRNVERWPLENVANHVNVSTQTVWNVATGRTWKWLK